MIPSSRRERRLWRIDMNDIRVRDEQGREYEVIQSMGVMDGCLTVTVGVDSGANRSAPRRANDRGHGHREDDSQ